MEFSVFFHMLMPLVEALVFLEIISQTKALLVNLQIVLSAVNST